MIRPIKLLISFTLFLFCSTFSYAQNWIDIGTVTTKLAPNNSTSETNNKRSLSSLAINAKLPIVLSESNVLIVGLNHQINSIQDSKKVFFEGIPQFSSSMLQLGLQHEWNEKSKTLLMAMVRLNTDYNKIDQSHFQMAGLILSTTKKTKDFHWKYGAYANTEYFATMIVPLFGFNWKINDKWRLKTVIPINLELSYQPKKWFRTGLFFEGINASYRITQYDSLGFNSKYIDKADNNLSLFSEVHLGKNFWFHLKSGISVLRKYRVYDNEDQMTLKLGPINIGDNRPESEVLFDNGWFIEGKIIYRLPLDGD